VTMLRANGISVHAELLEPAEPARDDLPTAVLLHGLGTDTMASWYLTLAQPLRESGRRVLMYDLRGHGHTERPASGYHLNDLVDDLEAVLDAAGVSGPVLLMGNSFGGTIAFTYALRRPERVAAMATVESAPPTEGWVRRVIKRLEQAADFLPRDDALAEITANRGERIARRAGMARELLGTTSLLRDIATSPLPERAQLTGIDCPVLCVFGGASGVMEFAPVVRELLPRVSIAVVPGQRHTLLIDQPQRVLELVMSWLDGLDDPDRGADRNCGTGLGRAATHH
jgi:pimeloyl-ACP methyl ester carboxylesterase